MNDYEQQVIAWRASILKWKGTHLSHCRKKCKKMLCVCICHQYYQLIKNPEWNGLIHESREEE